MENHKGKKKSKFLTNNKILIALHYFYLVFIILSMLGMALYSRIHKNMTYENAIMLFENGFYEDAKNAFDSLGNYKDSIIYLSDSLRYSKYYKAQDLFDNKKYKEAAEIYRSLADFEDSKNKLEEALYYEGVCLYDQKKYEEAFKYFQEAIRYENSELYIANITLHLHEEMQARIFNEACRLYESKEYASSLEELLKIEDYEKSSCLIKKCKDAISRQRLSHTISAGVNSSVALKKSGGIFFTGEGISLKGSPLLKENLVSIACFGNVIIGLKDNGDVVVSDNIDIDEDDWIDIIDIDAGHGYIIGLKSDGTVKGVGHNGDGQRDVENWNDIIDIATGWRHTVGLTSNGEVKITGFVNSKHRKEVESWTGIVAIAAGGGGPDEDGAGGSYTVGLTMDGHVVAAGDNTYGQCDVKNWEHIVAIATGDWHTVGLKDNGEVIAVGHFENGDYRKGTLSDACFVENWEDIVAISASNGITLGLTSKGNVMAVGYNEQNQRPDLGEWTDVLVCDEWKSISNMS